MRVINAEVAELVSAIRSNLLVLQGVGFWIPSESKEQYDDLIEDLRHCTNRIETNVATMAEHQSATEPSPVALESIEIVVQRHILAVLESCGGVKSKAAKILGIECRTLDRKIMSYVTAHPTC